VRLADFQARMRGAIIDGELARLAPALVGGRDPVARFAIHRRHYEASLVRALVEKFPAVVWLVGSPFVTEAAREFVRRCPPRTPCIAEYGEAFPAFVARRPGAERLAWLRAVGDLEWLLGRAAIAVERAPLGVEAFTTFDGERLADCTLTLQPGLGYLSAAWPVDELVKLFLSDAAPESYALDAEDVFLEVRGTRGAFSIARLNAGTFAFRKRLAAGAAIGAAAEEAIAADPAFDPGGAVAGLIAGGLATAITPLLQGEGR
jgi:hypothetical protein